MLTAVLVGLVGLVLVPSSASAAEIVPVGGSTCGWVVSAVPAEIAGIAGCNGEGKLTFTLTSDAWVTAGPPAGWPPSRMRRYEARRGGVNVGDFGTQSNYGPVAVSTAVMDPLPAVTTYHHSECDFNACTYVTDPVPVLYIFPPGPPPVPADYPGFAAGPGLTASTCANQWIGAKASWTADNGLTIIYTWVGAPPAKGWYWFGAAPGKVITATTVPKGPIPNTAKLAGPVGWYGLMKYPQPGPMVKSVRVYSIDDLGCYKDIPVTGGTTDAVVTDPTVPGNTSGVGSGTGDILPPGATDATPDPVAGPFDSCGNFFTDSVCYITGLPSWLFVPSEATKTDFGNVGTQFSEKAPIGWVTLAKNLADRSASGTSGKYACANGPGWNQNGPGGTNNTQGDCYALGVVATSRVGGGVDGGVQFLANNGPGGQMLDLFRPITTIVLLAGLYMGVGVWIGKRVLEKAVT